MTEAQQLKLATKRSLQQTHISQASGFGTDEGTGSIPGIPDVPTDEFEEEISWNSTDEKGDDDNDDEGDDGEEGNDDDDDAQDDDDQEDEGNDEDDQEKGSDDEQAFDEEEFIHPSLSIHAEEETRDEESFDPIPKTPESTDDEGNGEENLGMNVGREEGQDEEDEEDELYRDVNINIGRGIQMGDVHTTQEFEDSGIESIFETTFQTDVQTPTSVAPLPVSAPTLTPSTIATITTTQQAPTPPTTAPSTLLQDLPNFSLLFRFDHRLKTLEANFSEFMHTNQFVGAVSSIPGIVHRYMDQWMEEVVKVAVQIQSNRLRNEAQAENDEFLKTIDENMQKIIKEQVKEQVKTSYVVVADLSEMELKKILIEKMKGNKSIHQSNEQRNLYKALVEAYKSDKIILDTYEDTVTLKQRRDDDANKDEEPSAGSDRGSKRRREGKEPESASAPKEKATRSAGKSTQGFKSRQTSESEFATAEEPMQTTHEMEDPSHLEFETGANDQPIVVPSQHPEWFSQQTKPPTPNHDWNKTLLATHESIQLWISELVKQFDSRFSFNELMYTPVDFSAFLMNRLKVDTLTLKLLAGPTYELMKGSCKSLAATSMPSGESPIEGANVNSFTVLLSTGSLLAISILSVESSLSLNSKLSSGIITRTWIGKRCVNDKLYKFKEGDFKRLRIQDIEDMRVVDLQLGVESYQKKLNLTRPDTYRSNLKCKEAYIAYSNPRGFIYQNKDTQNRLMRINELHKLSDGTLTDVRTALDNRLKWIWMKYLTQSIWRNSDKDRAAAMI
nr:hypothetical protein [Tanacetum cinerariifolium]